MFVPHGRAAPYIFQRCKVRKTWTGYLVGVRVYILAFWSDKLSRCVCRSFVSDFSRERVLCPDPSSTFYENLNYGTDVRSFFLSCAMVVNCLFSVLSCSDIMVFHQNFSFFFVLELYCRGIFSICTVVIGVLDLWLSSVWTLSYRLIMFSYQFFEHCRHWWNRSNF